VRGFFSRFRILPGISVFFLFRTKTNSSAFPKLFCASMGCLHSALICVLDSTTIQESAAAANCCHCQWPWGCENQPDGVGWLVHACPPIFYSVALITSPVPTNWYTRDLWKLSKCYLATVTQLFFGSVHFAILKQKNTKSHDNVTHRLSPVLHQNVSLNLPYLDAISNNTRQELSSFIRRKTVVNVKLRCFQNTQKLQSWFSVKDRQTLLNRYSVVNTLTWSSGASTSGKRNAI